MSIKGMANPLNVRDISKYIEQLLMKNRLLSDISIIGEVSNLRKSGRIIYLTLIDDQTRDSLRCISFDAEDFSQTGIEEGDRVILEGSIRSYGPQSVYQLLFDKQEKAGQGNSSENLKLLKEKLYKKGYFDEKNKKKIPKFPLKIGLITSSGGAALRDFLSIAKRRNRGQNISIYPSLVQGKSACENIIKGLNFFDRDESIDLIVISRGGGSSEDLDIFNDEELADAIFSSKTPIISAVGHQIDLSICDMVSDKRAATPSEAAELAVPDMESYVERLDQLNMRSNRLIENKANNLFLYFDNLRSQLLSHSPERNLDIYQDKAESLYKRLLEGLEKKFNCSDSKLDKLESGLKFADPNRFLDKGYILALKGDKILKSRGETSKGDRIKLVFKDGSLNVEVVDD